MNQSFKIPKLSISITLSDSNEISLSNEIDLTGKHYLKNLK